MESSEILGLGSLAGIFSRSFPAVFPDKVGHFDEGNAVRSRELFRRWQAFIVERRKRRDEINRKLDTVQAKNRFGERLQPWLIEKQKRDALNFLLQCARVRIRRKRHAFVRMKRAFILQRLLVHWVAVKRKDAFHRFRRRSKWSLVPVVHRRIVFRRAMRRLRRITVSTKMQHGALSLVRSTYSVTGAPAVGVDRGLYRPFRTASRTRMLAQLMSLVVQRRAMWHVQRHHDCFGKSAALRTLRVWWVPSRHAARKSMRLATSLATSPFDSGRTRQAFTVLSGLVHRRQHDRHMFRNAMASRRRLLAGPLVRFWQRRVRLHAYLESSLLRANEFHIRRNETASWGLLKWNMFRARYDFSLAQRAHQGYLKHLRGLGLNRFRALVRRRRRDPLFGWEMRAVLGASVGSSDPSLSQTYSEIQKRKHSSDSPDSLASPMSLAGPVSLSPRAAPSSPHSFRSPVFLRGSLLSSTSSPVPVSGTAATLTHLLAQRGNMLYKQLQRGTSSGSSCKDHDHDEDSTGTALNASVTSTGSVGFGAEEWSRRVLTQALVTLKTRSDRKQRYLQANRDYRRKRALLYLYLWETRAGQMEHTSTSGQSKIKVKIKTIDLGLGSSFYVGAPLIRRRDALASTSLAHGMYMERFVLAWRRRAQLISTFFVPRWDSAVHFHRWWMRKSGLALWVRRWRYRCSALLQRRLDERMRQLLLSQALVTFRRFSNNTRRMRIVEGMARVRAETLRAMRGLGKLQRYVIREQSLRRLLVSFRTVHPPRFPLACSWVSQYSRTMGRVIHAWARIFTPYSRRMRQASAYVQHLRAKLLKKSTVIVWTRVWMSRAQTQLHLRRALTRLRWSASVAQDRWEVHCKTESKHRTPLNMLRSRVYRLVVQSKSGRGLVRRILVERLFRGWWTWVRREQYGRRYPEKCTLTEEEQTAGVGVLDIMGGAESYGTPRSGRTRGAGTVSSGHSSGHTFLSGRARTGGTSESHRQTGKISPPPLPVVLQERAMQCARGKGNGSRNGRILELTSPSISRQTHVASAGANVSGAGANTSTTPVPVQYVKVPNEYQSTPGCFGGLSPISINTADPSPRALGQGLGLARNTQMHTPWTRTGSRENLSPNAHSLPDGHVVSLPSGIPRPPRLSIPRASPMPSSPASALTPAASTASLTMGNQTSASRYGPTRGSYHGSTRREGGSYLKEFQLMQKHFPPSPSPSPGRSVGAGSIVEPGTHSRGYGSSRRW